MLRRKHMNMPNPQYIHWWRKLQIGVKSPRIGCYQGNPAIFIPEKECQATESFLYSVDFSFIMFCNHECLHSNYQSLNIFSHKLSIFDRINWVTSGVLCSEFWGQRNKIFFQTLETPCPAEHLSYSPTESFFNLCNLHCPVYWIEVELIEWIDFS